MKCMICDKEYKNIRGLGIHVGTIHHDEMTLEEYYNRYINLKNDDGKCIVCGKPTTFRGISLGYNDCCSKSCAARNPKRNTKIKKTLIEKYGVDNPYLIPKVAEKAQKNSHTDEAILKMLETKKSRYGYESPWQVPEILAKAVENAQSSKSKNARVKTFLDNLDKFEKENNCVRTTKLIKKYGQGWLHFKKDLDLRILQNGQYSYVSNDDIPKIEEYASKNHVVSHVSSLENSIVEYIRSIYDGEIIQTDRKILKKKELDIYIPDKMLAIEVDGDYWHSDEWKDKTYHLTKTEMCEELGIRLIHISELEWIENHDICKSLIASALGIYENRIYARNCKISEVSSSDAREFLNNNHLQGNVRSSLRLGLYYKNELVQLICIGKSRFKPGEIELLRLCTKINTQVIGGFSKLMMVQPYDEIVSYVDRSKFHGTSYINLGWKLIGKTPPSYKYWKQGEFEYVSRFVAQKHKLNKLLSDGFDPSLSEQENMLLNGWVRIYDCGNFKMIWIREKEGIQYGEE